MFYLKVEQVNLQSPLLVRNSFLFPIQNSLARREILIGALWLFVPIVGWLLNMGHRVAMVHKMQNGQSAWPSWNNYPMLMRHGLLTFLGMVEYHAPAVMVGLIARYWNLFPLYFVAALLWVIATVAVPGYMSHYCFKFDAAEIFDPFRALSRVFQGGAAYWKAWLIALSALSLSFVGFLFFGFGFFITSVWFWQVAGFSFATVFSQRFSLQNEKEISHQ